ncbi:MAG: HIT domain-containing protein [bacterium]
MLDCIFCKIINKKIAADIIYEDQDFVVFKDIKPKAETHLLIVPKKHIEWQNEFTGEELAILSGLFSVGKVVAINQRIFDACKFVFNVGKTGHINHIHLHLLGGLRKYT